MRKTTSLQIDEELWAEVKSYCATQKMTIRDFLEKILRRELDHVQK